MRNRIIWVVVGVFVALASHRSFGNGYKVLGVRSVRAIGMGEAYIAQADDPSAIAFNPAGLPQVSGSQLSLGGTLCNASTEHESPSGDTTDMEDEWQLVPAAFLTSDLGSDRVGLGFGVSYPNGLSSRWSDDSFARYVDTYSDLNVADIGPAMGVRVTDKLLIGAGLDYYYSRARLNRMVDFGAALGLPGGLDVRSDLDGSGDAWGFNAGLIYVINARHRVAATYRHPYNIEYDGDLTLGSDRYDADATVQFPMVVVLGYSYCPFERWTLEFDLDWTRWNQVGDVEVDFDSPAMPDVSQEQDLHNTCAYKFGAEYAWSSSLALRCGYIYNENATPDRTFRPSLPDTDTHFATAGFGFEVGRVTIDGALQLVFYETRTIDNNVDGNELTSSSSVDGTYRTFATCVSLSATYRF